MAGSKCPGPEFSAKELTLSVWAIFIPHRVSSFAVAAVRGSDAIFRGMPAVAVPTPPAVSEFRATFVCPMVKRMTFGAAADGKLIWLNKI